MTPTVDGFALLVGLTENPADRQPDTVNRDVVAWPSGSSRAGKDKVARSPSLQVRMEGAGVASNARSLELEKESSSPSPAQA